MLFKYLLNGHQDLVKRKTPRRDLMRANSLGDKTESMEMGAVTYCIARWLSVLVALTVTAGQPAFALAADQAEGSKMTVPEMIERLSVGARRGIGLSTGRDQEQLRQPGLSTGRDQEQLRQPSQPPSLKFQINFEFNSDQLTGNAMEVLDRLAQAIQSQELSPFRFRIEGHTDAVGSDDYNQNLSERRAAAVRNYLVQRFGIDTTRIIAIGLGKRHLLNTSNPAGSENRRVVVVNTGES